MKRHGFTTEADLVKYAGEWLRADGWETYFEVAPWGAGAARADIVATRGPLLAVVECKMALSLAVLDQCETWTRFANFVWAAVPSGKRGAFACRMAARLGFGVLQLCRPSFHGSSEELVEPTFNRRIDPRLRSALNDSQKQTHPGAASGYSTPFRSTCTRLIAAVRVAGGRLPVKEAMSGLRHHYSSNACARSSLIQCTERGVVPGLRLVRDGRAILFEVTS